MRRMTYLAAVAVVLLGGCGSGDTPAPPARAQSPGNDGVVEPSASASLPSGIVFTRQDFAANRTLLVVYDITTGVALAGAAAPKGATFLKPETFDPAMSRLAYVADCELRLASLAGEQYTDTAGWAPPQAYGTGKQCFRDPYFGDDGLLHATTGPSSEPGRIMSVDPAAPTTAPKDEGPGGKRQDNRYRLAGLAKSEVSVQQAGTKVFAVSVWGEKPGGGVLDSFSYVCPERLDATRRLCTADTDESRQFYGSVALLTLDPAKAGATATMKQIAPKSAGTRRHTVTAPDGRTVAIKDATGWYTTTLDGTGTPVRQPLSDQDNLGDILFWH